MRAHRLCVTSVALLVTAACQPASECGSPPCGTAVVVVPGEASVLLPVLTRANLETAIADQVFLKLAEIGMELNTEGDRGFGPRLARSWNIDDSLTISFTLDPRARWHDGRPVTADDVAFTFAIYRDSLIASSHAVALDRIASVTAKDSATVVVRFRSVYPEQFFDATYHMRIMPRHVYDSIPRDKWGTHPLVRMPAVGSGPYRLVRWDAGQSIELAADTSFFLGRPGLSRLIWRIVPDPSALVTQVVTGEADILEFLGGPENIARARGAPSLQVIPYTASFYSYLGFTLTDPANSARPHPLFGDRALRQAIAMSIDRTALLRGIAGNDGEVPVGPMTRMLWIWHDSIPQLPFDTTRARALFDSLGWRDANGDGIRERGGRQLEFEVLVPTTSALRRQAAVILQAQLRRVGVALREAPLDGGVFNTRGPRGQGDAVLGSWGQDPTPSSLLQTWTTQGIGEQNWGRYSNPAVDRLMNRAMHARDRATAGPLWRDAVAQINMDAPGVWLYVPPMMAAVHRRFTNVTIRGDQWSATLWTWQVNPSAMIDRDRVAAP